MKNRISSIWPGIVLLLAAIFVSCKDDWDSHFDRSENLPDENLWEIIRSEASLASFVKVVEATGYDSLLTSTQTYTVWAPVNDALSGIDMNDKEELLRIVNNHIARYSNSTAMPVDESVVMLNGKRLMYASDGTLTFGSATLLQKDRLASNGILHTVSEVIPYSYNLYEYAQTHSDYSELYDFISSFNEKVVSEELSTSLEIVYIDYNPLLESIYGIGYVQDEDSTYTMLLPDNGAWDKAYEQIAPYFKAPTHNGQEYADSLQKVQVSLAIVNSLVYRKLVEEPFAQYDSLVSTTGTVTHNVPSLFAGTTFIKGSNGNIYTTSALNYEPLDTWNPEIVIECEDEDGRTVNGSSTAFVRTVSVGDNFTDVSNNSYLEVTGSDQASVSFQIPNILSGKYEVYVDFVPPIVDGEEFETERAQVEFELEYMNTNGRTKTSDGKRATVTGTEKVRATAFTGVTMPVANYYDNLWWSETSHTAADAKVTTTLTVYAEKTSKNVAKFRIDKIRFVPVN